MTVVTEEAVRVVNEHFGGIKGHPIELKKCLPTDAAQALQCAQMFVGDPAMVAVLQGTVDADVQGFHATMSPKIPILGSLPLSQFDAAAPNSYYLASGQFGALGVVTFAKEYARARRISIVSPGGFTAAELAVNTLQVALESVNVDVTVAKFPFDSTDIGAAVVASNAATADLLIPVVSSPQHCAATSQALQQLGIFTPVLTFTGCLGSDVRRMLGDYPQWNYLGFSVSAEASATDDVTAWQVRAFKEFFAPLETRGVTRNGGVQMLQTVLSLVKILASVPGDTITPAAAGAAMKRFTGPVFLGVPRVTYGVIPTMPAIGSLASRVYVYLGNDSWRDTTSGQWLEPPVLQLQQQQQQQPQQPQPSQSRR